MLKDVYDPLTEYVEVFRERFKDVAKATFAELAQVAHIDVEANRTTCSQIYDNEDAIESFDSQIKRQTILCVFLWVAVAAGIVACFMLYPTLSADSFIAIIAGMLFALFALILKIHPTLSTLKEERGYLTDSTEELRTEAWKQMEPLNRLYDWDLLTRMMTKTVPRLEFDPYYTTQRLADLKNTYGWNDAFNAERSVIYSHSGLINGNPFVICRTKKMEWGSKTYYGSKTIYWTTIERDSNGKSRTVSHSQTLTASITAPYPEYYEKTRLIYGNTAAPDLTFYREKSGLAGKEKSLSFRWKKQALRRKSRNLSDEDFAMMTNEEFEVAFNTSDRNNNHQFALLFTPVAQESMLNLLQDDIAGYGDDFDFEKYKMINTIIPDHLQQINLDLNPEQYRHFDYDQAEKDFYEVNASYFRAIYFSLAPLLCVPMYQQIRPHNAIYGNEMPRHSSFWEHEALANYWGQTYFEHPECTTDCILKTEHTPNSDGQTTITVHAHGFKTIARVYYEKCWGGDGRIHSVPVYWDEYIPVTGTGKISIQEDNENIDENINSDQRIEHINNLLRKSGHNVYRRHIASKV